MLFFPHCIGIFLLKQNHMDTRRHRHWSTSRMNFGKFYFSWQVSLLVCVGIFSLSLIPEFGSDQVTVHFDSGLIHQNQVSYKWWKSLLCIVQAAWRRQPHAKSLLVARQPCGRNRFPATGSLRWGGIYYYYHSSPDNRSQNLAEKNGQSFLFSFLFFTNPAPCFWLLNATGNFIDFYIKT